jgi:hypothetical protein
VPDGEGNTRYLYMNYVYVLCLHKHCCCVLYLYKSSCIDTRVRVIIGTSSIESSQLGPTEFLRVAQICTVEYAV